MSAVSNPNHIESNSTNTTTGVASLFAGNVINLFLYGALTVQIYLYYTSFPQDSRRLKATVYFIYAIETVYTIVLTYDFGKYIVLGSGATPEYFISLIVVPVGGALVAFLTQVTYAYRLGVLSKSKYVSWCIITLIAANLVVIIVLALIKPLLSVLAPVWSSLSLVVDTTIAGSMIWSLTKNKILSKQLKSKITRLVHIIIGTGALTAALNLVTLILSVLKSTAAYAPAIALSKLYANSMMVFLNDRVPYDQGRDDQPVLEVATGALGSIRFETASGPLDTVHEQLALEGSDNTSSTSGRTAVKIHPNDIVVLQEGGKQY